jgi:putative nucleotidyltransferase with HDIG domain
VITKTPLEAEFCPPRDVPRELSSISLSGILSALSFALDLTEGGVMGHAVRSCLIGMKLAAELGVSREGQDSLYYALLLKDAGCSSNAGRMSEMTGGDDRAIKRDMKLEDWTQVSWSVLGVLWKNVLPGAGPFSRAVRITEMSIHRQRNNEEMIQLRCGRGAQIALKIGLGEPAARAIHHLEEHWDGSGYPDSLRGAEIPIASRIMAVAQHLDFFALERGEHTAMRVLQGHSGSWFDPELVKIAASLGRSGELWSGKNPDECRRRVLELAPESAGATSAIQIDRVCEAFAEIVDAKSAFTSSHSAGVAQAALKIAEQLGMKNERCRMIWRAALLHDVGKLSISNAILDTPSKLNAKQWAAVHQHPVHTQQILERIEPFAELAAVASRHHERLDGKGYPYGLSGEHLPLEARILAVADVYGALSEDRPYRPAFTGCEAIGIMRKMVPEKLDGDCFEALRSAVI